MTVRSRIIIVGGVLSGVLIAATTQSIGDNTRPDAKRPRIEVSSQQVDMGSTTASRTIDTAGKGALPPSTADTSALNDTGVIVIPGEATSLRPGAYATPWYSINSGGTLQVGAGAGVYSASSSIAQPAVGPSSSDTYQSDAGYWYGADTTTAVCACDCHADPSCDGVTNVLDVVQAVNVAFRGALPIEDPNPLCPYDDTDVDCGGFTNVIDVVKFVNVAFRGGNPVDNFCNPCP